MLHARRNGMIYSKHWRLTWNSIPGKTVLSKWGREKKMKQRLRISQIKSEGVHYHYAWLTRHIKRWSSTYNKRTLKNNKIALQDIKLVGKSTYIDKHRILFTVMVVDKSLLIQVQKFFKSLKITISKKYVNGYRAYYVKRYIIFVSYVWYNICKFWHQ